MESNAPQSIERPGNVARLFKQTLYGLLAVALVALAGIVCYAIFGHKQPICFGVLVLVIWALVAVCALCWLGYCCKRLLEIYSESRQKFSETELTLYQEAVRHERAIQDKQREAVQPDPDIEAKRKEVELAKLEKELRSLK